MRKLLVVFLSLASAFSIAADKAYYTVDGNIYDVEGNRYVLKGTYSFTDAKGKTEQKDCSKAALFTDPSVVPSFDEYPAGSLAGPECEITLDGKAVIDFDVEAKAKADAQNTPDDVACNKYHGFAPINGWARPERTEGHIGSTTFNLTTHATVSEPVDSWARYWGPGRWLDRIYRVRTRFTTGNAASSVWMTYKSYRVSQGVITTIC